MPAAWWEGMWATTTGFASTVRSAYVTPQDKLEGREPQIFAGRDRKLEEARRQRQRRHQQVILKLPDKTGNSSEVALN